MAGLSFFMDVFIYVRLEEYGPDVSDLALEHTEGAHVQGLVGSCGMSATEAGTSGCCCQWQTSLRLW